MDLIISRTENNAIQKVLVILSSCVANSWIDPVDKTIEISTNHGVRIANSKAGIKPTAPLSAFDKENSIESLLDFLHYLYKWLTLTLYQSPVLPYESLLSCISIDKKIKEKKKKKNIK